jgi:FkbM family methyltransferase
MIKKTIKHGLNKLGYTIEKIGEMPSNVGSSNPLDPNIWTWLKKHKKIRTLIDIGANDGQFGRFLSKLFSAEETFCFEPIPACIPQIEAAKIPNLKLFHVALSDHTGDAQFFLNSYLPASSLLNVSEISKMEFPETSDEKPISVKVMRLDDILDANQLKKDIFLKIDVQGLEDRVIKGGQKIFEATKFVLIEMSFVPFYDGQPLFEEVHEQLKNLGFRFSGIKNQINSSKTGQPLFCHCLYSRE